ncbi:MAG: N-acyl homoserine lactonase family protein, partial [Rhodospirillaceae bacterium]
MTPPTTWELYAVKYGTLVERMRRESFVKLDPHDDGPMPIDYYVWAAVSDDRTIVIDTGFDHVEAEKRGRSLLRSVTEGLGTIG